MNNNLGMSGITSKLSGSEIVEVQPNSASIPAANPSVLALGAQGSMVQSYGGNGGSRFTEDSQLPQSNPSRRGAGGIKNSE